MCSLGREPEVSGTGSRSPHNPIADQVWLLLICRLLQGMGSGTLSATNAYVSDAVGPEERAQALGWITACTSAGS